MQHLTARLTADAKVKTFESGRSVVNFNVATNHTYTTKEGEVITQTDFYECAYWRTEKVAPYLTKGMLVELYGRIGARAYEDQSGKPVAVLQLKTSRINFLSPKPKANVAATELKQDNRKRSAKNAAPKTEDLPF